MIGRTLLKKSFFFSFIGIPLFFSTGAPRVEAAAHLFTDEQCSRCHLTDPSAENLFFVEDLDGACLGCHTFTGNYNHPSGIVTSRTLSEGFWIDSEGRLVCATCHMPHPEDEGSPYLLRGGRTDIGFCEDCHGPVSPHQSVAFIAHGKSLTEPDDLSAGIDPLSRGCIACHDPDAPRSGVCIIGEPGHCGGHIVGARYAEAASGNDELSPPGALSPDIALYQGKIGCLSCHNIYSDNDAMLVVDNKASALCFSCHRK